MLGQKGFRMNNSAEGEKEDDISMEIDLGRETAFATVARFSMALLGFVGTVAFARILGQTSFGGYYFLFSIAKLLNRPIIGVAIGGKKRMSESGSRPEEIVGSIGLFLIIWCCLTALFLIPLSQIVSEILKISDAGLLLVSLIIAESTFEAADWLVQGKGKIAATTWIDFFRSLLTLPGQLILVLSGFGVLGMVFGLTIASLLSTIPLLYVLSTWPSLPTADSIRSLWRFVRYSVPTAFIGELSRRIDVILLGLLLSPAAVADYEAAAKLTVAAVFIAETSSNGLMTRLSSVSSRGEETSHHINNTLKFSTVFSLPIIFGSLLVARPLVVTIFGGEYSGAAILLVPLTIFRLLEGQNMILKRTMEGVDRPYTVTIADMLGGITNLAIGVALIILMGAVGVVLSTIAGEIVRLIVLSRAVREETQSRLVNYEQLLQIASSIVMFVSLLAVKRFVNLWNPVILLGMIVAGAIVYATVLLLLSDELRTNVVSLFSRMV